MTEFTSSNINNDDEISLKEIVQKLKNWYKYLLKQCWKIIISGLFGGIFGLGYAYLQPITYKAKLSFVVEDSKNSGGGLAALAGQFGFDFSGAGSGTLFAGDNILLFLRSESLIRKTLLTPYNSDGNYSLADKYADAYKLRKNWEKNSKINQLIYFPSNTEVRFTRLQDSLLKVITNRIILKELLVERPEKKATFIYVSATLRDELLSKFFIERLVTEATERYVFSKTKRQKINVDRLELRADSLASILNNKVYATASESEKLLDINPALRVQAVKAEVTGRDKVLIGTIYGEVVKNLEIAKMQLSQETPTIQIIDAPTLPLRLEKTSKILSAILFAIIISFLTMIYLVFTLKSKEK